MGNQVWITRQQVTLFCSNKQTKKRLKNDHFYLKHTETQIFHMLVHCTNAPNILGGAILKPRTGMSDQRCKCLSHCLLPSRERINGKLESGEYLVLNRGIWVQNAGIWSSVLTTVPDSCHQNLSVCITTDAPSCFKSSFKKCVTFSLALFFFLAGTEDMVNASGYHLPLCMSFIKGGKTHRIWGDSGQVRHC